MSDDAGSAYETFGPTRDRATSWYTDTAGYGGHSWQITTKETVAGREPLAVRTNWGVWSMWVPKDGYYGLQVHVPSPGAASVTTNANYMVYFTAADGARTSVGAT